MIAQMLGVGGKPCISGGILAVGSAIALMNEFKVNKDLANRLKQLQEEYKAQTANMDRTSLEYQKLAFDFALKGYRELESAYKTKARNYGMVQMISAAALAMSIIEMIPMPTPMCAQAYLTSIGAGIMMGISSSLKSTATTAAKEMNRRGNILEEIIQQFNKFHKDVQGLEDGKALADGNGGGAPGSVASDQKGLESKAINGENRTNGVDPVTGEPIATKTPAQTGNACIASNGIPDEMCSCRRNNSCMQLNIPNFASLPNVNSNPTLKKQLSAVEKNTNLKSLSSNFNDLSNGKISLARFVSKEERFGKNRILYANRLVERYNQAAPKKGLQTLVFDKSMIKKEKVDNAKLQLARSVLADTRQIEGRLMNNQVKMVTDVANRISGKNWREAIKFNKKKMLSEKEQKILEDFKFEDDKNVGDDELAYDAAELMGQVSYRKKNKEPRQEISQDQDATIWSILSNRYQKYQNKLVEEN